MTKSKKALAFIIFLFLCVAALIVYIFSELYIETDTEKTNEDTAKFKQEYEVLNYSNDFLNVNISDKNPFVYKNEYDILDMINNKETFIVYFGYNECNSCRSVLESFIDVSLNKHLTNIYYVNIKNIRDKYELDDNHELVKTVDGTEGYYKLLETFNNILDDYEPLTYLNNKGKEKKVIVNEKRIYGPTFIIVKNGNPVKKTTGISILQDNKYELNEEIILDQKKIFNEFFDNYIENQNTCSATDVKC